MKDIDGYPTPWKGEHRSLLKRLLRKLYVRRVDEVFIPKGTKVEFVKEYQKGAPFFGEIKALKFIKNGNEVYFFRKLFPDQEEWTE